MKTALKILLLFAFLTAGMNSRAAIVGQMNEDIDIFLVNASIPAERPNVLIIWDNTANWGQNVAGDTAYDLEKKALAGVINALPTGPNGEAVFNVGLMLFTETGGGNDNVRGSYVRYHIRPMTGPSLLDPVGNKARLANLISGLDTIVDRGSNAQYAKAFEEARRYYAGLDALAGAGQLKKDCAAFGAGIGAGPLAKAFNLVCAPHSTTYVSPISDGCQKNYIIFISNGTTDNGENNEMQKMLAALKGVAAGDPLPLNPNNEQANWSDEYTRYLSKNDISTTFADKQTIKTFSVAVYDKSEENNLKGPTPSHIALARSRAQQGEGQFFAGTNLDEIVSALQQAFARIKDVDGVFASTTLPVSINVRGTQLNQLYMGVFRPDPALAPRWPGNLKMYKLALDPSTEAIFLADADGKPAENADSGFINGSARSFWTTNSTFWAFHPDVIAGTLTSSDNPDGPIVDRGAVAQRLRETYNTAPATIADRNVYTCTGTCGLNSSLSGTPFNTANTDITDVALGVPADAAKRAEIINWVRGQDFDNENANKDASGAAITTDPRASIHGDVLHSRPAVINYNRFGDDNDIYAFYGANDAIFRAVKGGLEAASNPDAGKEAWGFVPPEFFGKLKRLRDNAPVMSPTNKRGYFMDGPIGVYQKDANSDGKLVAADGDKVQLFIGMRRGGRLIYALDVSNPVDPKMLWKKSNTDTGYGEMGFTWSEPKVARIRATNNPVLIMGLGYDPNQDNETVTLADTMGRGVMVIDATDGSVIWQAGPAPSGGTTLTVAGMTHSISSDITILDRDRDGFIDRLYVGDNGGNLWRIDINDANPGNWAVNKLASISGVVAADKRKFQFPPDVVLNPGASPEFDSVLIGTGDREHPFDVVVANRYYMFKDPDTGLLSAGGAAITEADLFNVDSNIIQVGTDAEIAAAKASLKAAKGWILSMLTGEKVISSSITLAGTTFFNTNQPTSVATSVCSNNLGVARQYALSFEDATATIDYDTNGLTTADRSSTYGEGGFLPSPVPVVTQLGDDNRLFQVVVAGTKVSIPPQAKLESRYRTYWYMRTD